MPEVRFDLPDARLAEYTWVLFDEHAPVAQTPLLDDGPFGALGPRPGQQPDVPRMLHINGYTYMREDVDLTNPFTARGAVATRDELREWRTKWLPEVDQVVALLADFDATAVKSGEWQATLDHHAEEFRRVFLGVHRYAVGYAERTARAFEAAYTELAGPGSETDARALLQGFPNASLDRASMLWDLSRTLRSDPALLAAIENGATPRESEGARRFTQQLAALLTAYGSTTNSNCQDKPTWREDPGFVYSQAIANARQPEGEGPLDHAAQQRQRREELEADLRSRTADAELLSLLEAAQEYLPNLEDHNYHVDQRMMAASRARYLSIGDLLVSRGLTLDAHDVFYIYQEELLPALEQGIVPAQAELDRRRHFVTACRRVPPPALLGKGAEQASTRTIKGVGASQGSYQGRARVIDSIEDAGRLQRGEVLVCRATTPAWTPLFGIAGAVVTNAGGVLSHTAIVAREFGIPAVLGTQSGTQQIPNGALITVDGTAGIVTIDAAE